MSLIVQKFGGTSLASPEKIRNAATRIVSTFQSGHSVVVVLSAMAGETNRLLELARTVAGTSPSPREVDVLLSTGEQQSVALLAMFLESQGQRARSFTGGQLGIKTDNTYNDARILSIDTQSLRSTINEGIIPVVTGFQGVGPENTVTTLGRGGSDTSAVAIAGALKADVCEIYTDVKGVYTADPSLVPNARKLPCISYEEMLEMASLGAKVLQIRSVKFAMDYSLPIHVRSSFVDEEGTWVVREDKVMERNIISGVTCNINESKVRVLGVKDSPGIAAKLFTPLAEEGIVVDIIVQNLSRDGNTDITFTVSRDDYDRALDITRQQLRSIKAEGVEGDSNVAKLSVVGAGMKDHAGVAARMFQVLADEGINIQLITTTEIKISVVVGEGSAEAGVRALHEGLVDNPS